ncbi:MAG: radical SAM protein [Clostridiales bacterium]|nr:radical SAM protein [Clostridiales bacterium]
MSNTVKKTDKDTVEILLVMTESCNLKCRYCYEKNKSAKRMELDIAKRIIDHEFEIAQGTDIKLVVQFFGGEPTLEFDQIRKIYDYIHEKNSPNYEYCFVVTNGTALKDNDKEWCREHREDFICGLSLDGTKEVQDYNRSNSYDLIDFPFFRDTWPNQKVKMTVSPDMLHKLAECVIHCHELGFDVLCNLADGVGWEESSSGILETECKKLIEYYLLHPEKEPCTMLKMPLLHVGLTDHTVFPKWCGAGDHIHAYDTDGTCYPCQMFMGITEENLENPLLQSAYKAELLPEGCQDCVLYGCCPTCIGTNMVRRCTPFYHTATECKNIKIQFLATSYLMYEKYKQGQLNLSDVETNLLLRNIYTVQNAFADL